MAWQPHVSLCHRHRTDEASVFLCVCVGVLNGRAACHSLDYTCRPIFSCGVELTGYGDILVNALFGIWKLTPWHEVAADVTFFTLPAFKKKFFLNRSCIRQSEWQWHLYELLHNWCFSLMSSSSGCCGGYAVNQPSITYGGALFSSAAVSCGRGYNRGGNIWVSLAQGSKRVRTAPEYSGISLYFLHSLNVLLFAMTGLVFQTENI